MNFLDFENQNQLSLSNMGFSDFFLVTVIFTFSTVLTTICMSQLLLLRKISYEKMEGLDYIPYEKRHDLEELMEESKFTREDLENIEDNIMMENTPDGNVIMRYSNDEEGFEYWADKQMEFDILKSAARKYCKLFCCVNLYIDGHKEYLKQKEHLDKELKEEDEREEMVEEEDDVFLKPKTQSIKNAKKMEIEWKENKFCYKGKVSESPLTQKKKPKEEKKQFSFSDFKKMHED
tara:strand:+ start:635 stop:1336 length:702 start_codon:yes stop_codon:yes gene_type:complete